jgi:hypothetical protein
MKLFKAIVWISLLLMPLFFIACGGGGSGSGGSDSGDTGTLSLGLTDASTDAYKAVYVTISEVKVHRSETADDDEGGWITVATPEETYNLLELVNGVIQQLGVTELESGTYTQMRLYLGLLDSDADSEEVNMLGDPHPFPNYVIDKDDEVHELKVPSGYQTGIKLTHEFEIVTGLTVDLVLDFDASASVIKAGKSGQTLLKPTIEITNTKDNAIIDGTVTTATGDNLEPDYLEGALVSAQYYEGKATNDPIRFTATQTYAGDYLMYLPPNTYNIVAYKSGFMPECQNIITDFDQVETIDFELSTVKPVTVTVIVSGLPYDEQPATISFRRVQNCEGAESQVIEVDKLNVGNGSYTIDLPEGEYTVVSSSDEMQTLSTNANVAEGMDTLTIDFLPTI